jgi:hypothetical protein
VGSAQEAPHPPRSPSRSSSRPPAPGAHATTYFSSTSPWATSPSRSSPSCPPLAPEHGDTISIERRRDSSSLHAIIGRHSSGDLDLGQAGGSAREASQLGRPRQAGGGAQRHARPLVWTAGSGSTASSSVSSTAASVARI